MDDNLLRKLDFNALKLLKILGEERNTKRAAERMFLSQPAISKQLKRLREDAEDEMFVRKQYGLEPTPYCAGVLEKLPNIFELIEDTFEINQAFIPDQYTGEVSIAINASLYRAVSRQLYDHLRPLMPNATLRMSNWGVDTEHHLTLARLHIGINYLPLDVSKQIIQKQLAHCHFELICREDHPVLKTERKAEDIAKYPLTLLQLPDFNKRENLIETKLRAAGITPNIGLRADQLSICLHAVSRSDSILPCVNIFDFDLPEGTRFFAAHPQDRLESDIGAFIPNKLSRSPLVKWLHQEISHVFSEPNPQS
ncbi:LysR family transcriptional regulator [uncultured Vibrio sp.]|uniref:LysR family transcriptional regulator n=1 Tax=uncultured Vibrio sp. TaxID=114054 RepID=UPI0025CD06EB|nr:LysR family transcriptional regulator [uncultured Vibrio sp.]